jgi:hypothetical protein
MHSSDDRQSRGFLIRGNGMRLTQVDRGPVETGFQSLIHCAIELAGDEQARRMVIL